MILRDSRKVCRLEWIRYVLICTDLYTDIYSNSNDIIYILYYTVHLLIINGGIELTCSICTHVASDLPFSSGNVVQ